MPPTKKTAPKRKRAAPAPSGPKKKQTVAAKQKHVRELAKAGRWAEIERLYGKKMVAKAKIYAEKHGATKTPQEIAREILLKNGYTPVAPQAVAKPTRTLNAKPRPEPRTRVNTPVVGLTDHAEATSSPETLTKEQQELVERRRRDALERRRRAQKPAQPPSASKLHPVENVRSHFTPSVVPVPELPHRHCYPPPDVSLSSNRQPDQPPSTTHRVVTPDNLPTANPAVETDQVRPEYFWDDLEAAAEIVQWENEHMAEVALEQPSTSVAPKSFRRGFDATRGQEPPKAPSISQELAAAAEIIQWENEHEYCPEVPEILGNAPADTLGGDISVGDQDAPQFQLLPIDAGEAAKQPATRAQNQSSHKQTTKRSARHKRPLEATSLPATSESDTVSNNPENVHGRTTLSPPRMLPPPRNQRGPTAEFIDKHLLNDKLELPVLEFLDMMLA